jgi:hypothetical protein
MHAHYGVPIVDGHVDEHAIAHNAGVGNDRIETTERVDSSTHEVAGTIPVADVVTVRDCFATRSHDGVDDFLRRADIFAFARERSTNVIHNDLGAFGRKGECVLATQTATGAGDDDYSSVTNSHYSFSLGDSLDD